MKISTKFLTDTKAISKNMTYLIIVCLVGVVIAGAYGYSFDINEGAIVGPNDVTPPTVTPPVPGTSTPGVTPDTIMAAKLQWLISDALTKTATGTGDSGYVGITVADQTTGRFDLLDSWEKTEYDAAPDTSSRTYSTGQALLLAVSSDNDPTSGDETYPRWFYISNLQHGAPIKALPLANPISALVPTKIGTTYEYTISDIGETVGTVVWMEAATPYWDLGVFEVYGRVAKASVIQQFTAGGVVLTTFSDGATWEDTDAEINANHTMTADKEDLNFQMIAEANDVAWGLPFLGVSANGEVSQYNSVLVFTTDALGVDVMELYNDGWQPINKPDLTADLGFYYVITTEGVPNTGEKFSISIPVTIDDAGLAASTEFEFEGWAFDCQKLANVERGATTAALPGVNGIIAEYGIDTVLQALALTVSSGSAATMQSMGHFTTNA